MNYARKHGDREKARDLEKQLRTLPSRDTMDPGYRRLKYSRYADDHILGFIGPKAEAEEIKAKLAQFLRETLGLELSAAKTLITHARTSPRGTSAMTSSSSTANTRITSGRRSVNGTIALRVPPGRGQGPERPLPAARQTVAPVPAPEPDRLRHHQDLRSRIPRRRELLPARPGRLAAEHPAVERRDVHAENPRPPTHDGDPGIVNPVAKSLGSVGERRLNRPYRLRNLRMGSRLAVFGQRQADQRLAA